jgi:translation initiation factor IF-2
MAKTTKTASVLRPPIVAVLGHVDHGKTTLLDTIRKTNVAAREHGGITQHVGAYQIQHKEKKGETRAITFIDTPGHEAFAAMRTRGATAADIAILVVAADDSVKPQTVESIAQIKDAGIPMIIAANKIDLPGANVEKLKADLARAGVQVEGFGGDVPLVPVSAKVGTGVESLLSTILLLWDLKGAPIEADGSLEAVVIETRVDRGRGMVATLIIKRGVLVQGNSLFENGRLVGKVRAIMNADNAQVERAVLGMPVIVLGFTTLPKVGALLATAAQAQAAPAPQAAQPSVPEALPDFLAPIDQKAVKTLNLILKADTTGSLEAIAAKLNKGTKIVSMGVGDIGDADVLLAKSSGAIIIGFGVTASASVAKLAQAEKVIFRTYTLIYELLDELEDVLSGMETVFVQERELGTGTIVAEFPFEKQRIVGTQVTKGRLAKGDSIKIMRKDVEVGRAKIKSMRRGKEEVTKSEVGQECGVLLDKQVDFALQDVIIAFTTG